MKVYLLQETGVDTRVFWTFEAADNALTERVTYWVSLGGLVTDINKTSFTCYLNDEVNVSISEKEVEG